MKNLLKSLNQIEAQLDVVLDNCLNILEALVGEKETRKLYQKIKKEVRNECNVN
jgi:hypothetical protein